MLALHSAIVDSMSWGLKQIMFGDTVAAGRGTHLLEPCTICGMISKPRGRLAAFLVALPKKDIACGGQAKAVVEYPGSL